MQHITRTFFYVAEGKAFLRVQLQASSHVVAMDKAFELVCVVEGACDLSGVTWSKDGQDLELGSTAEKDAELVAMVISAAESHHGGQYCCSVENKTTCTDIVIIGKQTSKWLLWRRFMHTYH